MKRQLLLCIKDCTDPILGVHLLAKSGTTYTLAEKSRDCDCGSHFVRVDEVTHPYPSCIEGNDWLPGSHFIPLNDPDYQLEKNEVPAPTSRPVSPLVV